MLKARLRSLSDRGTHHCRLAVRHMAVELEYGEPPPRFLGHFPLTVGVQAICVCHGLACIVCIATMSSVVAVNVWGYEVLPGFQVVVAAWHLLGVSVITAALFATIWRQALPLQLYLYYLLADAIVCCVITVKIFQAGLTCSFVTESKFTQRVGVYFSCHLVSAVWELFALNVLAVMAYMCYSVWHLGEYIVARERVQHLFEHEDLHVKSARQGRPLGLTQAMQEDAQLLAKRCRAQAAATHPAAWTMPEPGVQPNWGTVKIQTTTLT